MKVKRKFKKHNFQTWYLFNNVVTPFSLVEFGVQSLSILQNATHEGAEFLTEGKVLSELLA